MTTAKFARLFTAFPGYEALVGCLDDLPQFQITCDGGTLGRVPLNQAAEQLLEFESQCRGDWLPIATAPKDGTAILAFCEGDPQAEPMMVFWERIEWFDLVLRSPIVPTPTHWISIPPWPGRSW